MSDENDLELFFLDFLENYLGARRFLLKLSEKDLRFYYFFENSGVWIGYRALSNSIFAVFREERASKFEFVNMMEVIKAALIS